MNFPLVSVTIVTWNSLQYLPHCLHHLRNQQQATFEIIILDNGSTDGTVEYLRQQADVQLIEELRNTGFSAGHNKAISRASGEYALVLNPDVFLTPSFLANAVKAMSLDKRIGQVSGKLYRVATPEQFGRSNILDSTGMYFTPNQRHWDRGAGQADRGQFEQAEYIFGVSGAAALYRRAALEDVAIGGEYFDEDFFAYREDADLSWRMQLMGWQALYMPQAVAYHVRSVRQGHSRVDVPAQVNLHSVKNRFLMRLKNQTAGHALRFALPMLARDILVIGYVLLAERSSLPGLGQVIKLFPKMLVKRRQIMRKKRAGERYMAGWFRNQAAAIPAETIME